VSFGYNRYLRSALGSAKAMLVCWGQEASGRSKSDRYGSQQLSPPRLRTLGLGLGIWQGEYQDIQGAWLRWYGGDRHWIATPEDQATQERQRAERLATKLRELGVEPE